MANDLTNGMVVNKVVNGGRSEDLLLSHLDQVVNKSWNFAGRLEREQDHFMNAIVGMTAEAGETLDIHKKMFYHQEKERDFFREKVLLEMGDVLYYFLKLMDLWGFTLQEIVEANRRKLESRHPELGVVKERFDGRHIR